MNTPRTDQMFTDYEVDMDGVTLRESVERLERELAAEQEKVRELREALEELLTEEKRDDDDPILDRARGKASAILEFFTFLAVITCCAILAIAYIVNSARTVTPNYLIKQEKYHA